MKKFLPVALIIILQVMPVFAQENTSDTPLTAYLLQDNQLKTIDETTGNRELVAGQVIPSNSRADRADQRLLAASIDHQAKFIYLIEGWGRSTNRRILGAPTGAELVQFDIAGGGRKVIGNLTTVFNVVPSPDGSQLIVFYYDGEYLYAVQRACVVHLGLNPTDCRNVSLDYVGTSAFWLDNQSFVIGTNEVQSLRLVSTTTGSVESLSIAQE